MLTNRQKWALANWKAEENRYKTVKHICDVYGTSIFHVIPYSYYTQETDVFIEVSKKGAVVLKHTNEYDDLLEKERTKSEKEELCKIYKGEDDNPYGDNGTYRSIIWSSEKAYVLDLIDEMTLISYKSLYVSCGLRNFEKDDNVPMALKAIIFIKYRNTIDRKPASFMSFYTNYYKKYDKIKGSLNDINSKPTATDKLIGFLNIPSRSETLSALLGGILYILGIPALCGAVVGLILGLIRPILYAFAMFFPVIISIFATLFGDDSNDFMDVTYPTFKDTFWFGFLATAGIVFFMFASEYNNEHDDTNVVSAICVLVGFILIVAALIISIHSLILIVFGVLMAIISLAYYRK